MNKYLDHVEMFMEPKTTQYGSHMVMENVVKHTKNKYINIDTRFRDDYNTNPTNPANYTITLPERINDVKSISITNIEIPMTQYNISTENKNHFFKVKNASSGLTATIDISSGIYNSTNSNIYTAINAKISNTFSDLSVNPLNNGSYLSSSTNNYVVDFSVDSTGIFDKFNLKSKLGWLLGFRDVSYNVTAGKKIYSESFTDLNGPRYLYLAIDEFSKGNQSSFISPLSNSFINKNIIARISLDNATHGFGTIFSANRMHGTLISDTRSYTGKTDLQKLNVQLLNECGNPVNLNGLDFSFCVKVDHD